MGLTTFVRSFRPSASQLFISLLIAGLGWLSGQALSSVDQDLRIMYTEYTLGATDLAHISADVMRYRNTIIRALASGQPEGLRADHGILARTACENSACSGPLCGSRAPRLTERPQ